MSNTPNSSRSKRSPVRRSLLTSMEEYMKSFHDSSVLGDRKKVKKLLNYGLNVDCQNEKGQTALYLSCLEGHEGIVELLLRHGANPNKRSFDGDTAVHAAANNGNTRILNLLVEAGGDLRLHNRQGLTARDWAWKLSDSKKRKSIIDFIEKRRSTAITQSGVDLMNMSLRSQGGSKSLGTLKRARNKSLIGSTSVHSDGFGQIFVDKGASVGALATVPIAQEGSMKHDPFGYTYDNGPFMVMESMLWNKEPVTAKRLHLDPREGGHVDLLISELAHMSRLSHPSILLLMGTCRINKLEGLVLIFERVGLGSLFSSLYMKMDTLSRSEIAVMLQQIANALLYLHRQSHFHCWVSSHSIQLIRPGFAKLSNFEYMIEGGSNAYVNVLENKYLNATYNWLAPEILAGHQPSEKSDLYGLCAVLWECVNGQQPWHNVYADTIVQEVLERGHTLELDDHIEDPFNIMLEYGLSRLPDDRRLSLEQMRDHLSEYIADCERLKRSDQLEQVNAQNGLSIGEKQGDRHAYFSPNVEVASTSSGEEMALSIEDINNELDNQLQKQSLLEEVFATRPKVETKTENTGSLETSTLKDKPALLKGFGDNEEAIMARTSRNHYKSLGKPDAEKLETELHQPLNQSTPLARQASYLIKPAVEADRGKRPPIAGDDRDLKLDDKADQKVCTEQPLANNTKESSSRLSFDFIQNPLKKAFFEGSDMSPHMQGAAALSSKCSTGSVTLSKNGMTTGNGEQISRIVDSKSRLDESVMILPGNDAFALKLRKETEEFLKTPTIRSLPTETKFMKHTYGYYSSNVYRPKKEYERRFESLDNPASYENQSSGIRKVDLRGANSPTFGVSLKELKGAVHQRLETSSNVKEDLTPRNSESNYSLRSSRLSQASDSTILGNEVGTSLINGNGLLNEAPVSTNEIIEAKKPVLSMAIGHQNLGYVVSRRQMPRYSSKITPTVPLICHNEMAAVEDEVEKEMISSSYNSKSVLTDIIKTSALKNQVFVQMKSPILGSGKLNSSSLGSKARIFGGPVGTSETLMNSQERQVARSIKPASHHEPCLLKPSKTGLTLSPQPGAKNSSGYGEQLSFEKDHLSMTLPSKTTAYKDKRLEMLKNEMDAMHRFKSDSVLQNKPDGVAQPTQPRSSPQTPAPSGIGSNLPEFGQEVNIKSLISSYQNRLEEHIRRQSVLTLRRNQACGGDSFSISSPANKTESSKMNMAVESPNPVAIMRCLTEGESKRDSVAGRPQSSVETKKRVEPVANGICDKMASGSVCTTKSSGKSKDGANDLCVSKLQLSLSNPTVDRTQPQITDKATKEVNQLVNQAILNSHKHVIDRYVHQNCPHKNSDIATLKAALGVDGNDGRRESKGNLASGSSTKLGTCSWGRDRPAPSTAAVLPPRFHSVAVNTSCKEHQERSAKKTQTSPVWSASSQMSSTDIKEFYYDDELNSSELNMEKHLKLQSTADFDSNENIIPASPPLESGRHLYMPGIYDGRSGGSDGRREINVKDSAVIIQGAEPDLISKDFSGNESGRDTDTDSTMSSMAEALCVTKRINTSRNEGYSSSVVVESHAKGYHTITCNKLDPLTGSKSTTYRAKVKAPRVITKFILDDDSNGNRPFQA